MSWSESGLFYASWRDVLKQVIPMSLLDTNNKLALSSNADTPDYISSTDPSTWTTANEVTGTNWPSGGIALTTGAYAPTITQSPSKTLMWDMNNVSVAGTTISTPAYGCYIYANGLTPKALIIGIYFGGPYTTISGTFAISWNALGIATIALAA